MEQLFRMGFSENQIIRAIDANLIRSQENQSRYIQRLVSWLIDHPISDNEEEEEEENEEEDEMDIDYEINRAGEEVFNSFLYLLNLILCMHFWHHDIHSGKVR